jgi:hypothetical protein
VIELLADFASWIGERLIARLFVLGILVVPVVLFIARLLKDYEPNARGESDKESGAVRDRSD